MKKIFILILLVWYSTSNSQTLKIQDLITLTKLKLPEVEKFFQISGLNKLSEEAPNQNKLGNVTYIDPKQTLGDIIFPFKYLYSTKTEKKRISITTDLENFQKYIQELNNLNFKVILSEIKTSTENFEKYYTVNYQDINTTIVTLSPVDITSKTIEFHLTIVSNEDYDKNYKP